MLKYLHVRKANICPELIISTVNVPAISFEWTGSPRYINCQSDPALNKLFMRDQIICPYCRWRWSLTKAGQCTRVEYMAPAALIGRVLDFTASAVATWAVERIPTATLVAGNSAQPTALAIYAESIQFHTELWWRTQSEFHPAFVFVNIQLNINIKWMDSWDLTCRPRCTLSHLSKSIWRFYRY